MFCCFWGSAGSHLCALRFCQTIIFVHYAFAKQSSLCTMLLPKIIFVHYAFVKQSSFRTTLLSNNHLCALRFCQSPLCTTLLPNNHLCALRFYQTIIFVHYIFTKQSETKTTAGLCKQDQNTLEIRHSTQIVIK